ncbi:LysR family transcriptional regulator [Agrobacterium sp. MOPV5]|uniref:LysR family transcriptional regulator n=1 Tax=Agrobacterium leguminum TaxID=2792015 RepID=UPI0018C34E62|nr:LysR family transcriptional regulator [Agrobacterium leguminum]MBG0512101.1 LysR family transcriptional regulator [Agrobacterium leguminum]
MELRHIRYFLAIAEERNFTRAADRLGLAQPPLSMQIKDLEREIGVQLFHRSSQGATLTEAGIAFKNSIASIPAQIAVSAHAARRAAKGEIGHLRLGFTGSAALNPIVASIIRAFHRRFPDAEVSLEETNSVALAAHLAEDRLDTALLRPSTCDRDDLVTLPLLHEDLVVAIASGHAGGSKTIDLRDLRSSPLILTPRMVGTSLHDAALETCRIAGVDPIMGPTAPQIGSLLSLVSAELGYSLVPASLRQLPIAGVVFRELTHTSIRVGLAVAHRKDTPSQIALNFVKVANEVAQEGADG